MTDLINALFETFAAIFLSLDLNALRRDRKVAGISIPSRVFFVLWGLFNPWFYGTNGLMWSMGAGILVCIVNLMWVFTYIFIRNKQKKKDKNWDDWRDDLIQEDAPLRGRPNPNFGKPRNRPAGAPRARPTEKGEMYEFDTVADVKTPSSV